MKRAQVLILDFGSQYTQLIARRLREMGVYCEIHPFHLSLERAKTMAPHGIILSGGPSSVYEEGAPQLDSAWFALGVPMLGICYGAQLIAHSLGGRVTPADRREYGRADVSFQTGSALFPATESTDVWMSHGDHVDALPPGFGHLAQSANCTFSAFADENRRIYAVQFHPEVVHSVRGTELLSRFALDICKAPATWSMASMAQTSIAQLKSQVGNGRVVMGLSGGVDSSVAAALLHRAVGERLTCIYVDHGLARTGEREQVDRLFRGRFGMDLRLIDAEARFLRALEGVTDPEEKRRRIGHEFIAVFEEEARGVDAQFLGQGTLYPDVIESVSLRGASHVIKSHHNVGGLPEKMHLALVEPLRELFKDEVRVLGAELGLPHDLLWRQPFPGPGLAVRCLGAVTKVRLDVLRAADLIVDVEVRAAGAHEGLWQWFGVLLPVKSVGVMGDLRTYEETLAIRAVRSTDGMTADWAELPYGLLATISSRIINEVRGINRVVYDITSKPPGTIEWE